jgi:YHS domain-containing protein
MLIEIAAAFTLFAQAASVTCPVTGSAVSADSPNHIDYNGVRSTTCCGSCPAAFKSAPAKALASKNLEGKLVGISLFDPVSGARISEKDAKGGFSDYKGTRFYFASADEKTSFDASPKKFGTAPTKEALFCPVFSAPIKDYASAGGYVDVAGTRYYVCCGSCLAKMKADAATYTVKATDKVKDPAAIDVAKE